MVDQAAGDSTSFNEQLAKLMGRGKRHYICNEVELAVQCFEEANQMLNKEYGQLADECGEAYLFYGKSLIDLARKETGILGGALKVGEDQNDDDSEDDEDVEDDEAAENEQMETEETPDKDTSVDEKTAEKSEEPAENAQKKADAEEAAQTPECNIVPAGDKEENKADTEEDTQMTVSNTTPAGDKEENKADTKEDTQMTESNTTPADDKEENKANTEEDTQKAESNTTPADDKEENKADTKEDTQMTESNTTPADKKEENKADTEEDTQKAVSNTTPADDKEENKANTEEDTQTTESNTTPADDNGQKTEAKRETGDTAGIVGDKEQPADSVSSDIQTKEDGAPSQQESKEQAEKINDVGGNEEDITTMELAWEILELSRLIHERQETREARLNLAQTYLKLGEIQMERELFLEAIDEFHKCYKIQKKYLEADDRLLAETLYNIGLAYSIHSPPQHKESKENYTNALHVIELRMKKIEARLQEFDSKSKGKQKAKDDDPCVKDRKELSELQDLYPEIKAKISDAQEMMTNAVSFKAEQIQSIAVKKPNGDTAATDISHLVKRKRKPEGPESSENADTDGPAKKPRQENGTENINGH